MHMERRSETLRGMTYIIHITRISPSNNLALFCVRVNNNFELFINYVSELF